MQIIELLVFGISG